MRVLLVEDNAPLREALAKRLRSDGFAVDEAGDGKEGLWLAVENPYSLVVLDLTLPGIDGIEVLQRIRQSKRNVSVLITTARDSISERIVGLDAGADDYLIKPFALDEFMARVRAQVRRVNDKSETILKISDLEVDTKARVARRAGVALDLTAKEFCLLELLSLRTVSRADIWEQLYDFADEADSNVIDVFINRLRKKSELGGSPRLIHTRRGLGYVLIDPESK